MTMPPALGLSEALHSGVTTTVDYTALPQQWPDLNGGDAAR